MISINELAFAYKKNNKLFSNLNLNILQGGICGLLGKNGSGKTTLLKLISGLIFPDAGSCKVLDLDPSSRHPNLLKDIYYLPEEIFVPDLTITQFLKSYSLFYPQFDESLLNNCLDEFSLLPNQSLQKLSYGQKKKFLISFGLATGCRILILDEPTNGLDIPSKAQFRKLLAATISDEKLYMISTHQIHDVENLIDSVMILDKGQIIIHNDIYQITKSLSFGHQSTLPSSDDCFYFEKDIAGYKVVLQNETDDDSNINLELLFNAVLANKTKMQQLLGAK